MSYSNDNLWIIIIIVIILLIFSFFFSGFNNTIDRFSTDRQDQCPFPNFTKNFPGEACSYDIAPAEYGYLSFPPGTQFPKGVGFNPRCNF